LKQYFVSKEKARPAFDGGPEDEDARKEVKMDKFYRQEVGRPLP